MPAALEGAAADCAGGSAEACVTVGDGFGPPPASMTPEQEAMARHFYAKACELESSHGCFSLALVTRDDTKRMALLTSACSAGHGMACVYASRARLVASGCTVGETKATATDPTVVAAQEACATGDAKGCNDAGSAYLSGSGAPFDGELALHFLMRGCDLGAPCFVLAGALDNAGDTADLIATGMRLPSVCKERLLEDVTKKESARIDKVQNDAICQSCSAEQACVYEAGCPAGPARCVSKHCQTRPNAYVICGCDGKSSWNANDCEPHQPFAHRGACPGDPL